MVQRVASAAGTAAVAAAAAALVLVEAPTAARYDEFALRAVAGVAVAQTLLAVARRGGGSAGALETASRAAAGLVGGALVFHAAAVAFGAPVAAAADKTALWAALCAAVAGVPSAAALGFEWSRWEALFFGNVWTAAVERPAVGPAVFGALLGAWGGAIPIPLDWDRPWQVWPVSCTYGLVFGHLAGAIAGLVVALAGPEPADRLKKE